LKKERKSSCKKKQLKTITKRKQIRKFTKIRIFLTWSITTQSQSAQMRKFENLKIRNFANLRQVTSASKASTTGYPGLVEGDAKADTKALQNKKKSGSKSQGTLGADMITLHGDNKFAAMQYQDLCTRCARGGHHPPDCPHLQEICHQCGKKGHLIKACAQQPSSVNGAAEVARGQKPAE
jgi:hypothetical protein